MKRPPGCIGICSILMLWCLHGPAFSADPDLLLVQGKVPSAAIYVSEGASWAEKFAAQELSKYVKRISGAELKVHPMSPDLKFAMTPVIVGAMSDRDTRRALKHFSISIPGEDILENPDAFLICAKKDVLALAGTTRRSTIYAVYDFLEREFHVGFFRIAERIPAHSSLAVRNQFRIEKPFFKYRIFATDAGTPIHYSNWIKSRQDWLQDVEYRIKKKLNPFEMPYGVGPREGVMSDLGVDLKPPGRARPTPGEVIAPRLKEMGASFIGIVSEGDVGPEFLEKYPDARYIEGSWVGKYKNYYIHPADPLFERYVAACVRHLKSDQGNVDAYLFSPYPEKVFGADQEERKEILTALAREMGTVVAREAPGADLLVSSWAFHNKVYWTEDIVESFFESVPSEVNLVVKDFASNSSPFYVEQDYFWGQRWIFGLYYQDGPGSYIHGDIGRIIKELKRINAENGRCVGIFMMPEVTEPNEVMAELGCRMGWNPDMTVEEFLDDYVLRRYGRASFDNMRKAWQLLALTVYGAEGSFFPIRREGQVSRPGSRGAPRYHDRLGTRGAGRLIANPVYVADMKERQKILRPLREAIFTVLKEAENQEGSLLYYQDTFEFVRQFIVELFNQNLMRAEMAFALGDREQFQRYAAASLRCVDLQIGLHRSMLSWPAFSFAAMTSKGKSSLLGDRAWTDILRWMAGVFGGATKIDRNLCDYWRMDKYESLNYYYHARTSAYLAFLEGQLAQGITDLPVAGRPESTAIRNGLVFPNNMGYISWDKKGDLADVYDEIGMRFAKIQGWELGRVEEFYVDNPIPAIEKVMKEVEEEGLLAMAFDSQILTAYEGKRRREEQLSNLVVNAGFENDVANWAPAAGHVDTTVSLQRETEDTHNGSAGALRVRIRVGSRRAGNHTTGVRMRLKAVIKKGRAFRVVFHAKGIGGSSTISVRRPAGGSRCGVVNIAGSWQRYAMAFDSGSFGHDISELIICGIPSRPDGTYPDIIDEADSEFLIDDVKVLEL